MEWVLALTTLVLGLMAGFFLASSSDRNKRRADELQDQLDSVSAELDEYRGQVTKHFVRTAELVDALAANSREIYNHLAEGSQSLCDANAIKLSQTEQPKLQPDSESTSQAAASVVVTDTRLNITKEHEAEKQQPEAVAQPDEGWYEIMPETEDADSPVHKKADKKKEAEPA